MTLWNLTVKLVTVFSQWLTERTPVWPSNFTTSQFRHAGNKPEYQHYPCADWLNAESLRNRIFFFFLSLTDPVPPAAEFQVQSVTAIETWSVHSTNSSVWNLDRSLRLSRVISVAWPMPMSGRTARICTLLTRLSHNILMNENFLWFKRQFHWLRPAPDWD